VVAVGEAIFAALARHGYTPEHLAKITKILKDLAANPATFSLDILVAQLDALLRPKKKGKSK
jgi:hypothetical protein